MGTGVSERQTYPLTIDEYFKYQGLGYPLTTYPSSTGTSEKIGANFAGLVQGAYKSNGVVFACMLARMMLFCQARFQFQNFKDGRPGDLFGNADLIPLHKPWQGSTTLDLLTTMIADADMAGDAFIATRGTPLGRLRPDWVQIVYGSPQEDPTMWDLDAQLLGYLYQEGGPNSGKDPVILFPEEVAHWAPIPDPMSPKRGMSWLMPVVREIQGDIAATTHKQTFFDKGATVNLAIEYDPAMTIEIFDAMTQRFDENHNGAGNAFKTAHLLGATAHSIGADFQQMDFKAVQGADETRIAAASGIHPTIVGLSEGLQGSSLNQGNFAAARRLTADKTLRPLWQGAAGALSNIVTVPARAELAADLRDVAFLREDEKDAAEIQEVQARTITTYVNAGYDSDSVVAAVVSDDPTKLKHTGLLSVQLQPPGTVAKPEQPALPGIDPTSNGKATNLDAKAKV
jgi:hypothetical protein